MSEMHEEMYDCELQYDSFLSKVIEESEAILPQKFCFILGAGASRSSKIKTGQELVDKWDRELNEQNPDRYKRWRSKHGITDENKHSFYSAYYDERYRANKNQGISFLIELMEDKIPSAGYVALSYILSKTENKIVLTTNFDHLIETALSYYRFDDRKKMPVVIVHEEMAHHINPDIRRPLIVKLHRDIMFTPRNTDEEVGKFDQRWNSALDSIFRSYSPIFVGYAGNDGGLMKFLSDNAEKFKNGVWKTPYWLVHTSKKIDVQIENFLKASAVFLVRGVDFDRFMMNLASKLDFKAPNGDFFKKEADRYQSFFEESMASINDVGMHESRVNSGGSTIEGAKTDTDSHSSDNTGAIEDILPNSGEESDDEERDAIDDKFFAALNDFISQNYESACNKLRELVDDEPNNASYHDWLGVTLHKLGRYEEALEAKRVAVRLDPDNARYHNSLGVTLHELGHYEEALEAKRTAIRLDPDNARYHDSLSVTFHILGRYEEAVEEDYEAVRLDPDNARYHDSLGVTLHELGHYEEALEAKRTAVRLDPDKAGYQYSLGVTLHKLGRYEEALEAKRTAVRLDSDDAGYQYSLGLTLHELGRYEEALEAKRTAVRLDPDNARYHDSLSVTLHILGRYEEAVEEDYEAVRLDPDNARYHDSLGVTLHELGRYEEALEAKRTAVRLDPDDTEYQKSLNKTLLQVGCSEDIMSTDLHDSNETN